MKLLEKLERKLYRFAVPHLTLLITIGQVVIYVLWQIKVVDLEDVIFYPDRVLNGEVWRLFTLLFTPPITNPIFAFFAWYLFYLMGSALEGHWGRFRYNLFLLVGYLATVGVAFFQPGAAASNGYLGGSVFLAFAYLYPEFEIYLFFILPVKIKWLAMLTWIFYFIQFAFGAGITRLTILASVVNFLLFFGREIYQRLRYGRRIMTQQAQQIIKGNRREPLHRCAVCGATDVSHPQAEFRYCTGCDPATAYCLEHLEAHPHVKAGKVKEPPTATATPS